MPDREERTRRRAAHGDVAAIIALLRGPDRERIRDALLEAAGPDELCEPSRWQRSGLDKSKSGNACAEC